MSPRYLGLALFAEGETDHRFLDVVIQRAVGNAIVGAGLVVQLSEVMRLPLDPTAQARAARIVAGARAIQGGFHLLFVHSDGGTDPERAMRERVTPGADQVGEEIGRASRQTVGVVPVRETEAWALADGSALRTVLSTRASDDELGVPANPADVERIQDPKRVLDDAVATATRRRRARRRRSGAQFLDRLAGEVDLALLRSVPSFRAFERDLMRALRQLHVVS